MSNGTYVELTFDEVSLKKLRKFKKSLKLTSTVRTSSLHITVMYSKKEFVHTPRKVFITVRPKQLAIWECDENQHCLVLIWDAPEIIAIHQNYMQKYNATYDYSEYVPHTTLAYNVNPLLDVQQFNLADDVFILHNENVMQLDLTK